MLVAAGGGRPGSGPDRHQPGCRPAHATARAAARAPWLGARLGDRRACLRRARRGVDGADPGDARRRHGPRRQPLVPHAARGAVRADRRPGPDPFLRSDLPGLVLPRELRGAARARNPVLRPGQRLARAQPGVAVHGAGRRLVHRPAIRAGPAGVDRRLGGAGLAEPGRVPGRRGAERHHRRRLRPRRRRPAGERLRGSFASGPGAGREAASRLRARDRPGRTGRRRDRGRIGRRDEAVLPGAGRGPHRRGYRHRPSDPAPSCHGGCGASRCWPRAATGTSAT